MNIDSVVIMTKIDQTSNGWKVAELEQRIASEYAPTRWTKLVSVADVYNLSYDLLSIAALHTPQVGDLQAIHSLKGIKGSLGLRSAAALWITGKKCGDKEQQTEALLNGVKGLRNLKSTVLLVAKGPLATLSRMAHSSPHHLGSRLIIGVEWATSFAFGSVDLFLGALSAYRIFFRLGPLYHKVGKEKKSLDVLSKQVDFLLEQQEKLQPTLILQEKIQKHGWKKVLETWKKEAVSKTKEWMHHLSSQEEAEQWLDGLNQGFDKRRFLQDRGILPGCEIAGVHFQDFMSLSAKELIGFDMELTKVKLRRERRVMASLGVEGFQQLKQAQDTLLKERLSHPNLSVRRAAEKEAKELINTVKKEVSANLFGHGVVLLAAFTVLGCIPPLLANLVFSYVDFAGIKESLLSKGPLGVYDLPYIALYGVMSALSVVGSFASIPFSLCCILGAVSLALSGGSAYLLYQKQELSLEKLQKKISKLGADDREKAYELFQKLPSSIKGAVKNKLLETCSLEDLTALYAEEDLRQDPVDQLSEEQVRTAFALELQEYVEKTSQEQLLLLPEAKDYCEGLSLDQLSAKLSIGRKKHLLRQMRISLGQKLLQQDPIPSLLAPLEDLYQDQHVSLPIREVLDVARSSLQGKEEQVKNLLKWLPLEIKQKLYEQIELYHRAHLLSLAMPLRPVSVALLQRSLATV